MARKGFTLAQRKKGTLKAIRSLQKRRDARSKRLARGLAKYARKKGWL